MISLLTCQVMKLLQIANRAFKYFPVADDMVQPRLLFENIAGLFLVVPEILPLGKRFEFFKIAVFIRDVKDILRAGRFFFLHSQWLLATIQS
jgi:hypothetical protein